MLNTESHQLDTEKLIKRIIDLALNKIREDIVQPFPLTDVTFEFEKVKFIIIFYYFSKK